MFDFDVGRYVDLLYLKMTPKARYSSVLSKQLVSVNHSPTFHYSQTPVAEGHAGSLAVALC